MPLLKLMYNYMGFPYDLKNINSTLGDLLHGGEKKDHGRYYRLNRDINFDPNHWKRELDEEEEEDVERSCGEVIQELGYPLLT